MAKRATSSPGPFVILGRRRMTKGPGEEVAKQGDCGGMNALKRRLHTYVT